MISTPYFDSYEATKRISLNSSWIHKLSGSKTKIKKIMKIGTGVPYSVEISPTSYIGWTCCTLDYFIDNFYHVED